MTTQQLDVIFAKVQKILGNDYLIQWQNLPSRSFFVISSNLHHDLIFTVNVNYSSYLLTIVDSSLTLYTEGDQLAINENQYFVLKSNSHLVNFIAANVKKMDALIQYKIYRVTLN